MGLNYQLAPHVGHLGAPGRLNNICAAILVLVRQRLVLSRGSVDCHTVLFRRHFAYTAILYVPR